VYTLSTKSKTKIQGTACQRGSDDREAADGTVAVRRRDTREQEVVPFEQFLELIRRLRSTRALDLGQPLVKS
jgi:glycyl-tRNA synthetase (class II)